MNTYTHTLHEEQLPGRASSTFWPNLKVPYLPYCTIKLPVAVAHAVNAWSVGPAAPGRLEPISSNATGPHGAMVSSAVAYHIGTLV